MIIAYFMSSMVTKRIGRLRLESHDYGMSTISRTRFYELGFGLAR